MSKSHRKVERAYKMIKRDRTDEALEILRPIVASEPDNVHAWWVLAYAESDPEEVRNALNRFLELDPGHSNAPKAREMLARLNEQYPPQTVDAADDAMEFGDVFMDDLFGDSPVAEDMMTEGSGVIDPFSEDPFADLLETSDQDPFRIDETLEDLRDSSVLEPEPQVLFGEDAALGAIDQEEVSDSQVLLGLSESDLASMDAEELEDMFARAEEKAGRRSRPLLRLFATLVGLLVVVAVAGVIVLGLGGTDDESADPGALVLIEPQPVAISEQLAVAQASLAEKGLASDGQAVVARSPLGDTFFVEFCAEPGPDLPQYLSIAMSIAVEQAPLLAGEVDAVGVSVNACNSPEHDTLYRAYVSLDDAVEFLSEGPSADERSQAQFQEKWLTP